ncbi:MAG: molybdenum cofactor guanylyltransferase [Cytophagales bacterium]
MNPNSTIGLVLCGGQSARMGSDKGLIKNNNISWSIFAFGKLSASNLETFISINSSQIADYEDLFRGDSLIVDNKELQIKGPLLGILSAHLKYPEKNILVLACDMLDITNENISHLLTTFKHQNAICYAYQNSPEPLLGIYSSSGLKNIYQKYTSGNLLKFSMMHMLELLEADFLPLSDREFVHFKNYNSPQDLN